MAATPFVNEAKIPLNLEKMEKKSSLNSFWGFVVFIIIYISAFYVFSLSPSTTKFWFIISNSLIIIILADSGAFSSSSKTKTFHFSDQHYYYNKNNLRPTTALVPNYYIEYEKNTSSNPHAKQVEPREEIKIGVVASDVVPSQQQEPQVFITEQKNGGDSEEAVEKEDDDKYYYENSTEEEEEEEYDYDNSTEEEEEICESGEEEEGDEFSRMSDEEVNRRVEDFIRRFRLQALNNI